MNETLYANLFFFITATAIIIFSAILCVAIFHLIKVLKTLRRILDRIEEGTEVITEDVRSLRAYFAEEGFVRRLIATVMGSVKGKTREPKSAKLERKKADLKVKEDEI